MPPSLFGLNFSLEINNIIAISISTVETAFAAGWIKGSLYGKARIESIIIGSVVQSEFLVTTHDAPNSPNDIAIVNIAAIRIEPLSIGILIKRNLLILVIPKVCPHSSYFTSKDRIAGKIILTTKGVVIMM